eukprot:11890136-Karenia_brevis.AAC.1
MATWHQGQHQQKQQQKPLAVQKSTRGSKREIRLQRIRITYFGRALTPVTVSRRAVARQKGRASSRDSSSQSKN